MSGAAQGYIGRNPGDSQVTIARQQFTPTGVTTDFTFASGYTAGYVDVYINGAKILVGRDYTATNGSVVGLTSAAQNGDIVEIVAYKAFNVNNVAASNGNFTVGGILTVDDNTALSGQLEVTGVSTFAGAVENVVSTGIVTALGFSGNITGAAATFTGDVSIGGTLTYEDVTNIDSVGIVTARAGVNVSGGQLLVGSGVTIGNAGVATFSGTSDIHLLDNVRLNVGDGSDLTLYHDGSNSYIKDTGTGFIAVQGSEVFLRSSGDEKFIHGVENDRVDIYYNNSKKFETTNDGTVTTGIATATGGVNISGGEFKVGTAVTVGSVGVSTFTKNVNIEGNVAIGLKGATASGLTPVLQLHKKASSSTSYLHITNTDSGVSNSDGFLIGFNGSNDALIFNKESTPLRFATAGAEQMRIAADGKVGIDSTAPNFQLDVGNSVGSATTVFINATLQAQNTASRAELRLGYSHSGGNAVGYIRLDEAATNSFDGSISIGVPSNNGSGGSSTEVPIKFKGSSATDNGDIEIYGTAAGISSVTWDGSANTLIFKDKSYAAFGDSSDLKIYHDSNNTRIDNNTGQLKLRALNSGASVQLIDHNDTAMLQAVAGGTVSIAHNNSTKLSTTTTGVSVTGTAAASAFGQSTTITNTASVSDHYWKIGEATMNGSEGFTIHFNTGQGYSSGAEAVVHTTCVARAQNNTTLVGYWYSTSMSGAAGVKDIRWKYTGANNIYEIWVKGNQYANLTPIVDIFGGSWTSFNSNTGSSTAPTSSTAFNNGTHYTQVDGYNTIQYNQQNTKFLQNINMASGKGINFHPQGGSDVNLLDDYETGTWTPVLSNDGTAFTSISNSSSAHYTKIGRLVTISMYHRTDGVTKGSASDSDNVIITGLPFTPNSNIQRTFVPIGFNVNWAEYPNQALIQESTTHIALYKYASSGGNNTGTRLTVAAVATGSNANYCLVTMVYQTT